MDGRRLQQGTNEFERIPFHATDLPEVLSEFRVQPSSGLSEAEAEQRLRAFGPNVLEAQRRRPDWAIFLGQFRNTLTLLLVAATALSYGLGDIAEGTAILAVILVNATIGFVAERKAIDSIEALRRLGAVTARVRRGGATRLLPAEQLVPGDLVMLEAGDVVSADLRLVTTSGLECDESLLTGESVPVTKSIEATSPDAQISDRSCLAFKGTSVTGGVAEAIVVATGTETELGSIAELVERADAERTPLEQRLSQMSGQLLWVALVIMPVIFGIGVFGGKDVFLMLKTGIALAIAAIPEGLPIVATLALAQGMWRLARRHALVRRLSAVETLGSVTVIFADKTGTLTENRMTVTDLVLPSIQLEPGEKKETVQYSEAAELDSAARILNLCTNAELTDQETGAGIGDPMEVALLHAARRLHMEAPQSARIREEAFDPRTRMMATFHQHKDQMQVSVKGAPEAVLLKAEKIRIGNEEKPFTKEVRQSWEARVHSLASTGKRIIALAERRASSADEQPYQGLVFIGLVALWDPPRDDARPVMELARHAGIKVIMATGDNADTAASIAQSVGLANAADIQVLEGKEFSIEEINSDLEKKRILDANVFARVDPKQKLDLIALYQQAGEIVAMTGDGVNDAPALKKADIGVAMGLRGTEVAREAADVVLKDDAFGSIIAAIRQGRVIFSNIRKFIVYLMSCNVAEVCVVAIGTASGLPLPLMPLQILFLNLVTDVFPALALGLCEGEANVLDRPPRDPAEPLMGQQQWTAVGLYGALISFSVLGVFYWAVLQTDMPPEFAVTVAFLTLAFAQLWHVFNMRAKRSTLLTNQVTLNPYVWGALVLCTILIIGAVYTPPVAAVLNLTSPSVDTWVLIIGVSFTPLLIGQIYKLLSALRVSRDYESIIHNASR